CHRRCRRWQRVAGHEDRTLPDLDNDGRQKNGLHPYKATVATAIADSADSATAICRPAKRASGRRDGSGNPLLRMPAMLRSALTYAGKGMHVFPCLPRDKRPATVNGLKAATADPDTIRRLWQHDPQFNIAIATGTPSNIFVLDVDGVDAEAELRRLEAQHGVLPPTVEVITARGRHVYFRMPDAPIRN